MSKNKKKNTTEVLTEETVNNTKIEKNEREVSSSNIESNNSTLNSSNNNKIIAFFAIVFLIITFIYIFVFCIDKKSPTIIVNAPIPSITNMYVDENDYVNINFKINKTGVKDKIYYLTTKDEIYPSLISPEWKLVDGNTISYYFDDIYNVYLKNEDNNIIKVENTENLGRVTNISLNKNTVYLAIKGMYTPTLQYETLGEIDNTVNWYSENEKIAKVDMNGKITGLKKGNTRVHANIGNKDVSLDVVVTNLINVRPKKYDRSKSYVPCGNYNKEENDLLDAILEDRVKDAGYKTRAGVVEVGRFITLEFPYKIKYFSENGRLSGNGVDGEGRYYHKGLYLDESRFKNLNRSSYGPATWGCSIYSIPAHGKAANGLDCSGFISWVLYNGGFNVKDVGAGISGSLDLTDYGKRTVITEKLVKSGKIKVGDLLANGGWNGGHIALIVGEDDKKYYVVESLWTYPNVGALMMEYSKSTFHKSYNYVMLMDSYYKKDGNLTKMWY